jgi:hypothetical protein
MSQRPRIEAAPVNDHTPYTHLLPLVQALIDHGNRITLPGQRGQLFAPSQGGYVAYLAKRIDWTWLQETFELPDTLRYNPSRDEIFDTRNWVSVLGSQDA